MTNTDSSQLQDAIYLFTEAVRLAGIAQPRDSLTYTRACIGIAECRRELSHRSKFSYLQKSQHLADATKHLHRAYEEATRTDSDALLLRVKLERAVILARKAMVDETESGLELEVVLQARDRAVEELELVIEESRAMGRDDFVEWGSKWLGLVGGPRLST